MIGGPGDDLMYGQAGDDLLDGGPGRDTLKGGAGDDLYFVDCTQDLVVEYSGSGVDAVQSTVSFVLPSNVEILVLTGADRINGTGNGLDNIISGNCADNILSGCAGCDTLIGGLGSDVLYGGTGADAFLLDASGTSTDYLMDFTLGSDRIQLSNAMLSDSGAITIALTSGFSDRDSCVLFPLAGPRSLSLSDAASFIGSASSS